MTLITIYNLTMTTMLIKRLFSDKLFRIIWGPCPIIFSFILIVHNR